MKGEKLTKIFFGKIKRKNKKLYIEPETTKKYKSLKK